MTVRGAVDVKKTAETWLKQAQNVGKEYFIRSLKSHREEMSKGGTYSGVHAETYKLMSQHPWGQEYLKIEQIKQHPS
jgi:hypothetical protein